MKALILFLLANNLLAGEVFFQGPCEEVPFLQQEFEKNEVTVGQITIDALNSANTTFLGTAAGINSINDTPVGRKAVEEVGPNHLRAYGWCYEVNGFQPAVMPHQIKVDGSETIRWFFAYSTYQDGVWKDYCTPSYQLKSAFLCH